MPEAQDLTQQIQEQIVKSAQDFYGDSIGRLKAQLEGDRAQLQDLMEHLLQGEAQEQIQELVDSYAEIEESLDQAAEDQGVQDAVGEAAEAEQAQETAGQGAQDAVDGVVDQAQDAVGSVTQQAQDAAGGAAEGVQGALGQATDQVGQVAEGAQDVVGGVVGEVAENLAPGTRFLSQTTDEAGQTTQRMVDESGNIVQITLDESGNLLDEDLVGNLTDLPAEEEYTDEAGRTVRTVEEESGTPIGLQLGEDGGILGLSIPPSTEGTTEEVEETSQQLEPSGGESANGQEPEATNAAKQKAEELGVDLNQIEGSGAEGRITLKDVVNAAS